jgi:hypothetical protein
MNEWLNYLLNCEWLAKIRIAFAKNCVEMFADYCVFGLENFLIIQVSHL